MGQNTTTISTVRFYRQDSEPPSAADGATWVTPVDGAGNDTSSRYIYNASADSWELDSAVGPSKPTLGTPVAGSTWRDTSGNGVAKQYDGSAFVKITTTFAATSPNVVGKSAGTTYTNNGGGARVVQTRIDPNGSGNQEATLTVEGTEVSFVQGGNNNSKYLRGIVPNGSDYTISLVAGSVGLWSEQQMRST